MSEILVDIYTRAKLVAQDNRIKALEAKNAEMRELLVRWLEDDGPNLVVETMAYIEGTK